MPKQCYRLIRILPYGSLIPSIQIQISLGRSETRVAERFLYICFSTLCIDISIYSRKKLDILESDSDAVVPEEGRDIAGTDGAS